MYHEIRASMNYGPDMVMYMALYCKLSLQPRPIWGRWTRARGGGCYLEITQGIVTVRAHDNVTGSNG